MLRKQRGFTLYELVLTLTLSAILAGLAISSFAGSVAGARLSAEVNALFHAIHLARKESIMRRRVVTICPSIDHQQCSGSLDWSAGWIMFVNEDADDPPHIDSGEAVLQVHVANDSVRISANRRGFTLRATQKRATNGTIVVCDTANRVRPKALVVSYTGRPRVTLQNRRGEPYDCAD